MADPLDWKTNIALNLSLEECFYRSWSMQIFAKAATGQTITLDMWGSDSIGTMKRKIHEQEGVPPNQQRLTFAGKLLDDDERTLASYNFKWGDVIDLCVVTGMHIFVRTKAGKRLALDDAKDSDTINDVKTKIQVYVKTLPEEQVLTFAGQKLQGDRALSSYNILPNSTLDLQQLCEMCRRAGQELADGLRCKRCYGRCFGHRSNIEWNLVIEREELLEGDPGVVLVIKTPLDKDITIDDAKYYDSVLSVKAKVEHREGILIKEQRLTFAGKELEDRHILAHYHIRDNVTLHLEVAQQSSGASGSDAR